MPKGISEQEVFIVATDKKSISGTLVRAEKTEGKMVIFVHGLFGDQHNHIFFNGAHALAKKGIDSYRFDFYSNKKNTRSFSQSSSLLQKTDLESVVKYFGKKYSDITIVAHSMGGYISLLWNEKHNKKYVKRFVLLDPSWEPTQIFSDLRFSQKFDFFIMEDRIDTIIKKIYIDESKNLPSIAELAKKMKKPTLIIATEKGAKNIAKESYLANIPCNQKDFIVLNTDHNFNDSKAETEVFNKIILWINKKHAN
jgi:alpha/beta superfamily hydrolase